MSFKPCVVVPVYNHGETIGRTIAALAAHALHCFVVDDGSDVPTRTELATLAHHNPWITVERIEKNSGKGAAVMRGLRLASNNGYSHGIQIDADEQHDVGDVPRLLALAEKNLGSLVAGQPIFDASLPITRRFSRWITHFWVAIETLSLRPPDTMCGFRVYPLAPTMKLIDSTRLGKRMDFDIEVMVRLLWAGVPLRTLPTRINYPPDGNSHFRYVRDNILISWMHTRLVVGTLWRLPILLRRPRQTSEDSKTHWSTTKERGAIVGIRLLLWTYRIFGRSIYRIVLLPVMAYFVTTGHEARSASRTFLERAHRAGSPHPALRNPPTLRTSFRHFLAFGDAAIDTMAAWMGDLSDDRDLIFNDRPVFSRLAAGGTGAVIIGSHLGNMTACRALADRDAAAQLTVLMFTEHAGNFNRVLRQLNPRATEGVLFLDRFGPDTAMALQDKIREGGIVVLLGDRTPAVGTRHINQAPFLGYPAPFPQGPFILAGLLHCPVYLMFCVKVHRKYHVSFEPFATRIDLARSARGQTLQACVERYAARLEYHALKEPLQWFNFYDFWRTPRYEENDPKG